MANKKDLTVEIVTRYIEELEKNKIHIIEAFIFGSHAKRKTKPKSDIDVALISNAFTGNRFEDRRKIVPFRKKLTAE